MMSDYERRTLEQAAAILSRLGASRIAEEIENVIEGDEEAADAPQDNVSLRVDLESE